jgi:branched-subunit amino acid ABC-type transport system permease component
VSVPFTELLVYALNGVVVGSILALAAIGLTLVYGILNLANFAHGDYMTFGAYAAFFVTALTTAPVAILWGGLLGEGLLALAMVEFLFVRRFSALERGTVAGAGAVLLGLSLLARFPVGLPGFLESTITLGTAIAVVSVAIFAVAMDILLWRPLRRRKSNILTLVIVSIGLALALRSILQLQYGADAHAYPLPLQPPQFIEGVALSNTEIDTFGIALLAIVAVHLLLAYTRIGKAFRALADNRDLARASGIDVDRMVLYVWALAGGLAGLAGVLLAFAVNVNPNLGWDWLLPVFAAVILGGIGSAYGAMAGAVVLGIAMEMSVYWVPSYRDAVGFAVLVLALVVRPQGIFGVRA